jgi:hypothetical protein
MVRVAFYHFVPSAWAAGTVKHSNKYRQYDGTSTRYYLYSAKQNWWLSRNYQFRDLPHQTSKEKVWATRIHEVKKIMSLNFELPVLPPS